MRRFSCHRKADYDLVGFWIHLDVDVLDKIVMSAVDYHLHGGHMCPV